MPGSISNAPTTPPWPCSPYPGRRGEWTAYQTGLYNELCYTDVIDALEAEGMPDQAFRLRKHWEKKVKYFVCDNPNMFGSEYPFDSTGFESTHAFARYAIEHAVDPETVEGEKKGLSLARPRGRFMEMQTACNIFCRGWLEPAYFWLGSDYRGGGNTSYTLSYMAQMGGWSLLDYALYYRERPISVSAAGLRLVSEFVGIDERRNTPESNYGFWYPGVENDGGAGGGFEPAPYGLHLAGAAALAEGHGITPARSILGSAAGLRMAATVVADDPLFGMYLLWWGRGRKDGALEHSPQGRTAQAVPRGNRRTSGYILYWTPIISPLNMPIIIGEDFAQVRFALDNEGGHGHSAVTDCFRAACRELWRNNGRPRNRGIRHGRRHERESHACRWSRAHEWGIHDQEGILIALI